MRLHLLPRPVGVRAYFAMPTTALRQNDTTAVVYSATVYATEIHEAVACQRQPVNLFGTSGTISASTTWPGPVSGGVLQQFISSDGTNCPSSPANNLTFDNANVVNYFQKAANNSWPSLTFGLLAADEGNDVYWKRFALNPTAQVKFNFPPSVPVNDAQTPVSAPQTQ